MPAKRREALIKALKDHEQNVREAASDGLDYLEAREGLRAILESYKTGDAATKLRAILAVKTLKDRRAAKMLSYATKSEFPEVRAAAADTIGILGIEDASQSLIDLLQDDNFEVVQRAACALGLMECRAAVPALLVILENENDKTRHVAIEALGQIGSAQAELQLIKMLEDTSASIRCKAAAALGNLCLG